MIPQSAIHIDGNRAWVVGDEWFWAEWHVRDRPCDAGCNYGCDMYGDHGPLACEHGCCPTCDGTGRHTFEIEVPHDVNPLWSMARTLRVHVVPGMVLPIRKGSGPDRYSWIDGSPGRWALMRGHESPWPITLPPAAAPGMWAVQLEVHE